MTDVAAQTSGSHDERDALNRVADLGKNGSRDVGLTLTHCDLNQIVVV